MPHAMCSFTTRQITLRSGRTALLRHALPDDAAALLRLNREVIAEGAFMATEPDEYLFSVEQERRWIRAHLEHPRQLLLVVQLNGRVVACLDAECGHRRRLSHRAVIGMSVASAWRGLGVGKHLLGAVIAWADAHPHIDKLSLSVLASNERAVHLYQRFSFRQEGRRVAEVKLPDGRHVDDILMFRMTNASRVERWGGARHEARLGRG